MINFNQLRVFYQAAKHLSFTLAAKELYISQPAVTAHMKTLEDAFGITLFDKRGHKIYLTEEGKTLYQYAEKVFNFEYEIETAVEDMRKLKRGELRIGLPTTYIPRFTTYIIDVFKEKYPNLFIQVQMENSLSLMHSILNFEIELSFCSKVKDHPEVCFDHFIHEELLCIGGPDHRMAKRDYVSLREISKEPLIINEEGSGTRGLLMELFRKNNLSPNIFMESSNSEMTKNMVMQGKGISFLLSEAVSQEIQDEKLSKIHVKGHSLYADIYLLYLKNHHFSFPAKAFFKLLLNTLPGKNGPLPTLVPSWPEGCRFIDSI